MHELRSTAPPAVSPLTHAPVPDRASASVPTPPADRAKPSRLVPFLGFGSVSLVLFGLAGMLRGDPDPILGDAGDYSCLGACLSGVAAAIFGCVTAARATRKRRKNRATTAGRP